MNIKFISSAGYQLWASEGVIVRYIYRGVCSPDMDVKWEEGEMSVRAEKCGVLAVSAQLEKLIPVVDGDIEDLKPKIEIDEELKPKVTASLPPKSCDYEG